MPLAVSTDSATKGVSPRSGTTKLFHSTTPNPTPTPTVTTPTPTTTATTPTTTRSFSKATSSSLPGGSYLPAYSSSSSNGKTTTTTLAWITLLLGIEVFATELTRRAVFPPYVLNLVCRETLGLQPGAPEPAAGVCDAPHIVSAGNARLMQASLSYNLASVLTVPVLTLYMDRIGRRPLLIVVLLGLAGDQLACTLAPNSVCLVCLHAVFGLFGGVYPFLSGSFSMIADVTGSKERTGSFAFLEGCVYLAMAAGPFVGGLVADYGGGPSAAFYTGAALLVANAVLCAVCVPETLPTHARQRAAATRVSVSQMLPSHAITVLTRSPTILRTGLMMLVAWTCSKGAYYAVAPFGAAVFGWGYSQQSYLFAVLGVVAFVVCCTVPHRLSARVASDYTLSALCAMSFTAAAGEWAASAMGAACKTPELIYVGAVFWGAGAFYTPTLRGVLSKQAGPAAQAEVIGAAACLECLSNTLCPLLFGVIFDALLEIGAPSLVFAVAAVPLLALAVWLATCPPPLPPAVATGDGDIAGTVDGRGQGEGGGRGGGGGGGGGAGGIQVSDDVVCAEKEAEVRPLLTTASQ